MTSDPEELVRLQGYGEMTLRTAIATWMALAPRDRSETSVFRIRDGERLASGEIADLAADWGIEIDRRDQVPAGTAPLTLARDRPRHGPGGTAAGAHGCVSCGCGGGAAVTNWANEQACCITARWHSPC